MTATPARTSEPGAMLTALGTVLMTTIVALEQTGALNAEWTAAIFANSRELIGELVQDEAEREAVLRSVGIVEATLETLRASASASGASGPRRPPN